MQDWYKEFWKQAEAERQASEMQRSQEEKKVYELAVSLFGSDLPAKTIREKEIEIYGPPGSRQRVYTIIADLLGECFHLAEFRVKDLKTKGDLYVEIQSFDKERERRIRMQRTLLGSVQEALRILLEFSELQLIIEEEPKE